MRLSLFLNVLGDVEERTYYRRNRKNIIFCIHLNLRFSPFLFSLVVGGLFRQDDIYSVRRRCISVY